MLKHVALFGLCSVLVFSAAGCAPPPEEPEPEPVVEEEPPPPPPPTYELTEVAISEEAPDFTSRNIEVMGIQLGDVTIEVADVLGDQVGTTIVGETHYLTAYQDGGVVIYTLPQTGVAEGIELTTFFADEVADPNLQAWLEDGDPAALREWMGPEDSLENLPEEENASALIYAARGVWFIQRTIQGQDNFAVRFNQM